MRESTTWFTASRSFTHTSMVTQRSAFAQPEAPSATQSTGARDPSIVRRTSPTVMAAAGRARAAGITFRASVLIPKTLPFQDEELCALLVNMLDNALEGAERTPEGREKTIRFQMRVKGDFIPILCENTFDGHVETAPDGSVKTTKPDPDSHGFGLAQMRAVVEKYESILDVSWTDDHFTVQTAPQYPREG